VHVFQGEMSAVHEVPRLGVGRRIKGISFPLLFHARHFTGLALSQLLVTVSSFSCSGHNLITCALKGVQI
jgi:hypothetical protein